MLESFVLHKSWIVFVGTLFLGESAVLTGAALAGQGAFSLLAVGAWAFLGTLVADTVWFRSAGSGIQRWTADPDRASRLRRVTERIDRIAPRNPHRALLVVKFLYGTRIASIAYMAARRLELRRFVLFDGAGTAIWLGVLLPIGWGIGRGVAGLGTDLRRVEWIVLTAVVVASVGKGVIEWRRNREA